MAKRKRNEQMDEQKGKQTRHRDGKGQKTKIRKGKWRKKRKQKEGDVKEER